MSFVMNSPSAQSFRSFVNQTSRLTHANLKARYRKTIAGFLWVVISPLAMYSVQCYIFKTVLKIQLNNYPLFLLTGLLPWIFITQSLEMGTPIFVNSGRLLKSYPVNPLVYLAAQLLDNAVNFFATFIIILLYVVVTNPFDGSRLALLPFALLPLLVATFALAWMLATLNVFFRDTKFILSLVISIAFFMTPIFYPMEYVPEKYRWMVLWNPLMRMITPVRIALYQPDDGTFWISALWSCGVALLFLAIASLYWRWRRNLVYLYL